MELVAQAQWLRLPDRFPALELGAFIVMPNHLHGVIIIHDRRGTAGNLADSDDASYRRAPTEAYGKPVPGSVPTIVRSFKAAVSYRINLVRGNHDRPVWQRNYYEHVIRGEKDWDHIHRYIESNPAMWAQDDENPFRRV